MSEAELGYHHPSWKLRVALLPFSPTSLALVSLYSCHLCSCLFGLLLHWSQVESLSSIVCYSFSKFNGANITWGILLLCRFRFSGSGREEGLRSCFPNRLPSEAHAAGPQLVLVQEGPAKQWQTDLSNTVFNHVTVLFRNIKWFPVPTIKHRFFSLAFKVLLKWSQLGPLGVYYISQLVLLFMLFILPEMLLSFGNPTNASRRVSKTTSLMLAILTFYSTDVSSPSNSLIL